jgi:hypothetical protein
VRCHLRQRAKEGLGILPKVIGSICRCRMVSAMTLVILCRL